ncbi:MAG: hypothetical protein M0Q14_12045 [Tissierellaceae bacterium]|nr:hypothetical protein [Tissierellaceae bacterium]NBK99097.1 DUF1858 domain-containing protein [Erysipelotrichia bacterium]NLY82883.1 hypothetical protein [Clostridiales bacterium]
MITKNMTMLEIIENYPETEEVFRAYDDIAGKCLLCNNLFDSIETIAMEYSINSEEMLNKINILIAEK